MTTTVCAKVKTVMVEAPKVTTKPLESSYTRNVPDEDKHIVRKYINYYGVPLHQPHVVRGEYLTKLEIREYLSSEGGEALQTFTTKA